MKNVLVLSWVCRCLYKSAASNHSVHLLFTSYKGISQKQSIEFITECSKQPRHFYIARLWVAALEAPDFLEYCQGVALQILQINCSTKTYCILTLMNFFFLLIPKHLLVLLKSHRFYIGPDFFLVYSIRTGEQTIRPWSRFLQEKGGTIFTAVFIFPASA